MTSLLDESEIPPHMLRRSRDWFDTQMSRLERIHGERWPDHKEWLASYLNEEVKDLIAKHA